MYRGTWQEKLFEFFKGSFSGKPAEEKQTGGFITGPGGPRDDRVPIMASPGEFMLKASSAQKLGSKALEYMNQTGNVPGFADGGQLMTPGAFMHKRWMEKPEEYRTAKTPFQKLMPKLSKGLVEKAPWLPLGEHVPEWAKKHPQLYGAFGAAKTFTPYHEAEMAVGGSELGLLSLAILPFLGIGQKLLKGAYKGAKLGGKSLLKLFGKGKSKGTVGKPLTKSTVTGKYENEITKMVMETTRGGTNLGYALGARAVEQDVKILGTMDKIRKRLSSAYKDAMKAGDLDEAVRLGSKVQGLREGKEFAKVMIAVKSGKAAPVTSATPKVLQYIEKGGLPYLPKLDLPPAKSKLMGMLSEETGLGVPGGALQMVAESVGSMVGKASKGLTKQAAPSSAFETILERRINLDKIKDAVELVQSIKYKVGYSTYMHPSASDVLYKSPYGIDILKEIPKGAKRIKGEAGAEAFVLDLPNNKVMRIGDKRKPRLNIPEMLQADTRKEFGDLQVEVMPRVGGIGKATQKDVNTLRDAIRSRGKAAGEKYDFWDVRSENIGFVGKKPIVIDPGAIDYRQGGAVISSYSQGTPSVSYDQLAYLHKGEAVIPAEYNTGGFIGAPKFQAGGAVNPLKAIVGVGEEIGEAIVKKIEEASIKAPEIPPLEIGNLDELQSILGEGAVGAERGQSKLDQFVGKVDDELRRFDDELVSTSEKVTVLETNIQTKVDGDIRELKTTVTELDRKVTDIYTQSDRDVDLAAEKSELEAKLIETIDELKTLDLIPMKSNISLLRNDLNNAIREVYALEDKVAANINLNGLR
jgi:hypothetical protein